MSVTTTRRELSRYERPNLNDRERAVLALIDLGVLVRFTDIETFHGRSRSSFEADAWEVDPSFDNSGNSTGNSNVNKVPTLYLADRTHSQMFADARTKQKSIMTVKREGEQFSSQVVEIFPRSKDTLLFNRLVKKASLSSAQLQVYYEALKVLAPRITQGSPLSFKDKGLGRQFVAEVKVLGSPAFITEKEIIALSKTLACSEHTIAQLAGAYNSRNLLIHDPAALIKQVVESNAGLVKLIAKTKEGDQLVTFNLEYVRSFLQQNNIAGETFSLNSDTLNIGSINAIEIWDIESLATREQLETHLQEIEKSFQPLINRLGQHKIHPPTNDARALFKLVIDPYVDPAAIIDAARKIEGFESVFDQSCGNWEGYTLGQHTETVLRNFEISYADDIPANLLPYVRLSILVHDIGKPQAVLDGHKDQQEKYNDIAARDFLTKLGIDQKQIEFISSIIGPGQHLVDDVVRNRGGADSMARLENLAAGALGNFGTTNLRGTLATHLPVATLEVSRAETAAYIKLCGIVEACDGGAYTSMAITSDEDGTYRNSPSFNSSFAPPSDLTNHKIERRVEGGPAAPADLNPNVSDAPVSRVRSSRGTTVNLK